MVEITICFDYAENRPSSKAGMGAPLAEEIADIKRRVESFGNELAFRIPDDDTWRYNQTHTIDSVWEGAVNAARAKERQYGKKNLGPWSDFDSVQYTVARESRLAVQIIFLGSVRLSHNMKAAVTAA